MLNLIHNNFCILILMVDLHMCRNIPIVVLCMEEHYVNQV